MIRRGLLLREAIDTWAFDTETFRGLLLTRADWDLLSQIADVLEVLMYQVTCLNKF
jgi:hypothetical protein